MDKQIEYRAFVSTELRAQPSGKITGYAAKFGVLSHDLGGFRESIRPGTFSRAIREQQDVVALFNHDPSAVLGRVRSGTLSLSEDETGLKVEIDPPNTTLGRDIVEQVRRGDLDKMSFAFRPVRDVWPTRDRRELVDVNLSDVSIVTHPAYEATTVAVRGDRSQSIEVRWYTNDPVIRPLEPTLDYYGERLRTANSDLERERLRLKVRLARALL